MAKYNSQWEELGRNVQDIVDRAISSHDYRKLNQSIRQVIDMAVDLGGETVRKVADNVSRPQEKPPIVEQQDISRLYGSTGSITTKGILKLVGGGLLAGATLVMLLVTALFLLFTWEGLVPALLELAAFGAGAWVLYSGVKDMNMVSHFKIYRRTLGDKTHCSLEKLARSVGKNEKFVRKELGRMIEVGLLPEGHLDNEQTMLITSHATYHYFEQSRIQLEERRRQEAERIAKKKESTHSPQVREVLDKGEAFVRELSRCNDAIPGEEISRKISRMEDIVERIFDRADSNPEVIPDLKKLMDYYLPMTIKLLKAYAEMDAQPVQGETIRASMQEIEQTLDTLNIAFENLLDDLFEDTALDVSSDISVLNTLLAQEGLTEDSLTKMKKQRNL